MYTTKKLLSFFLILITSVLTFGQSVFINELHYDDDGGDSNEGFEIAGPAGTDLSNYSVEFYNGNNGQEYSTVTLTGTIPDESNGFGTLWFDESGIQNGAPDGLALFNSNSLVQFLSYEGSFAAINGTANGQTSTDIGVSEGGSGSETESLQLSGSGSDYSDFTWGAASAYSQGSINTGQTFSSSVVDPDVPSAISATPATTSCPGDSSTIAWTGSLNDATAWHIYDDSCGGNELTTTTSNTIDVTPSQTTTYYIRGEGGGVTAGSCGTVTVTVTPDTTPPTVVCQDITVQLDTNGTVSITADDIDGGSTDACGIASLNATIQNFNCGDLGANTVSLFVIDNNGNAAGCTATVTVVDVIDPSIVSLPSTISLNNDSGACGAVATWTEPTSDDNCSGSSIAQTAGLANGAEFPVGTSIVTYTATDSSNNTTLESFSVTVTDNTDPTITCAADQTASATNGSCDAAVTVVAPTTDDNCAVTVTNDFNGTADASGTYPVGTTVVIWTVTDASNNTATCSMNITVTDNEAPTIDNLPADISVNNDAGVCGADVTWVEPTSADNCTGSTIAQTAGLANGATFPVGVTTITYTATDASSNTFSASFTVTVTDNEAPTIDNLPANIAVNTDAGVCGADVTWVEPTSADNCTGSTIAQTAGLANGATFPVGATTITYTATDAAGLTTDGSFTITVTDNEAPTIVGLPADIIVNNGNGVCEADVTWVEPTPADNCAGSTIAQTAGLANGATFPAGVTTITYTATDAAGLTTDGSFTITVTDNEAPTIDNLPADIAVNNDAGVCGADVTWVEPTSADNCAGSTIAQTAGLANGATFPVGVTTITYTATDAAGLTTDGSFTITVTDNEAPNAVCQDITASVDASGNLIITGDDVDGGSTDNCTGMTLSVSPNTFDCTDTGTTVTVTLTATDAAGLTDTCTANVTIIDQVAPTAVCQDITVQLDATGNVTIAAADVDNGSSDACGGAVTLALTPSSSFDCDDLGANTVTLFVTDASGNSSFCTATVTVQDSVAPTITCAADQTQNLDAGLCTAAVTVAVPTISDNCSVASITNDFNSTADASDDYPLGTTTVTWTLTDGSGNTSTCTQDIVVTDNQAPVAVCQDITVQLDATGAVTINASDLDGGSTDCSSMTFAVSPSSSFDCDDLGPNTVTLFVTDANGLIGFCSAVVTVEDSIDPTIVSIPGDVAVDNDSGACGAVVSWTEPTTTDNCSSTISQTTGVANGLEFPVGTTTVTYVATDTAGNTTQDTFTVTVTDVEAPTASCVASPLTVQLDASGVATITADDINDGSSDNCTAANALTLAIDKTSFDCGDIGSTTVTLTVTDEYSNSATCTTTVNIVDTVAPAITCPANQTQSLGAGCVVTLAGYTGLATTSDNCAVSSVTQSPPAGTSILGETTTTVTLTVTDTSGNQNTCTFDVTTVDTTNPTISCAADQTQSNDTGSCDALVTVIAPTTSDFCGVASVTNDFNGTSDASGTYPVGTTTVVWTVTDDSSALPATFVGFKAGAS